MKALPSVAFAVALIAALSTAPQFAKAAKKDAAKGKKIEGTVVSVNSFTGQVTISTNDVPGMGGKPATVAFVTMDAATIKKFKEGDKVVGDLVTKGNDTHVENLALKK